MDGILKRIFNKARDSFIGKTNSVFFYDGNVSLRDFYPTLTKEDIFPLPTLGELIRKINGVSGFSVSELRNLWDNTCRLARKKYGKVPLLMELLDETSGSYDFKLGLGENKEFCKMANLDYVNFGENEWARLRGGAADYYYSLFCS